MHRIILAAAFARASAGSRKAAKMAIIAMTTKSSIRVKPERPLIEADIHVWECHLSLTLPLADCKLFRRGGEETLLNGFFARILWSAAASEARRRFRCLDRKSVV